MVTRIEDRIASLTRQLHDIIDQSRSAQQAGKLDVRSLSGQGFYRNWLYRRIMESQTDLAQKRLALEAEQTKLADAWKQRKVIEQLRQKQWRRHGAEVTREERTDADETALNVYLRKHDQRRDEVAA